MCIANSNHCFLMFCTVYHLCASAWSYNDNKLFCSIFCDFLEIDKVLVVAIKTAWVVIFFLVLFLHVKLVYEVQ